MQRDAPETQYTIADLARLAGVNVRTIRYYLAQGLLPSSGESGPGAHYGDGHLNRLQLTRRLQEQHLPLAEIRRRLAELTDAEAAELLAAQADERDSRRTSALEYVRNLLEPAGGSVGEEPGAYGLSTASVPPPAATSGPRKSIPLAASLVPRLRRPALPASMPRMRDEPGLSPAQVAPTPVEAVALAREALAMTTPSEPHAHERSQWERLSLGPNIEIHIRRPLSRIEQRRVERLITIARQVLKEDKP